MADEYDAAYRTRADRAENIKVYGTAKALWHFGKPGQFVDLGCGPGTAVPYLSGGKLSIPRWAYVGLDPSRKMIRAARRRFPYWQFRLADDEGLPRRNAQMILGAFGPMQYVDGLAGFANNVRMSLVPGGRFLLMGRPTLRPTRVLGSDAFTWPYSAAEVHRAFAGWHDMHVYGLRRWTPRWLPVRTQVRMLTWEESRADPDECDWLVIEGRRF